MLTQNDETLWLTFSQIELSCTAGFLDITYIVSLYPVSIATAVVVKNNGRKPVSLKPGIISSLRFKKRSGAGIQGLKGCSYCPSPPLSSPFELLSPSEAMKADSSGWFGSEDGEKPGIWAVEDSVITLLEKKMSRVYGAHPAERLKAVYNTPPSKYETIDQVILTTLYFFRLLTVLIVWSFFVYEYGCNIWLQNGSCSTIFIRIWWSLK